jgi:tRNA U34 5-carboxymethylaminomethyl modifying GTPase MnmE/TrmE
MFYRGYHQCRSNAMGEGAIGIVRISGPRSCEISGADFKSASAEV